MGNIGAALLAHMRSESQTLATLWRAKRTDGRIFAFTDLDADIVYDDGSGDGPLTYLASSGVTPSAIEKSADLSVDNMEMQGVLDSATITDADILAGLWDSAELRVYRVNYRDLSMGHQWLNRGTLGEVKTGRNSFQAEIRGLAQPLQQQTGNLYLPTCSATFCDSKCKLNVATFTHAGSVLSASSDQTFVSDLAGAAGLFAQGYLTWLTGANAGLKQDIKFFGGSPTFTKQTYTVKLSTSNVTVPLPSGSSFALDHGVVDSDGQSYSLSDTPSSSGNYSESAGIYSFNTADFGKTVTITYATAAYADLVAGGVTLQLAMPNPIAPGDTFSAVEGCDKLLSTCKTRFNNVVNMRGFPYLPGRDRLTSGGTT